MNNSYFISAGEFSGDLLAAELVEELRKLDPHYKPIGITGSELRKVGVRTILENSELSVMGVTDVMKKLGFFRIVEQRLLQQIDIHKPKFAVLVDFPGFHLRIAEQLKLRNIPVIQYIAPKVWAWGQKRVFKIKKNYDSVLGMLPFEEDFFLTHGVNYQYVGSPIMDRIDGFLKQTKSLKNTHDKIIAFLPGSREAEIRLMMPFFNDMQKKLNSQFQLVISVAENIGWKKMVDLNPNLAAVRKLKEIPHWLHSCKEVYHHANFWYVVGQSYELMRLASACVVTSGTSTLECALLNTPQIIAYKASALTYELGKKLLKVKYIGLPNLIVGREIVSEHIQELNSDKIAFQVTQLITDENMRDKALNSYKEMRSKLKPNAARTAAAIIQQKYMS